MVLAFDPCFKDAILSGAKRSTVRKMAKASVGDRFVFEGQEFEITLVQSSFLVYTLDFFEDDGFQCRQEMYDFLLKYYPDLKMGSIVWIHFFRAV